MSQLMLPKTVSGARRGPCRLLLLLRPVLAAALLFAAQPGASAGAVAPAPYGAATPQSAPAARVAVMLELSAMAATQVYAALLTGDPAGSRVAATRATQVHLAQVDAAQRALLPRLAAFDADVLYRTQRVYNGIATVVDANRVAELARLPGIRAVHPMIAKSPTTEQSVPHVGAPGLWQGAAAWPAVQGEGMRIAIIDTGIDYLHTDFGGPGEGYAANDPGIVGDVAAFPGVKVVGGYDFVGDRYNADPASISYQPLPEPDPDPFDCYGHGTHVAGIAAGYGVTVAGATYTGAYDTPLDASSFSIGPGVAPRAQLFALKVFGCAGSSDVVDLAIEWSVDPNGDGDFADRMDVINLSLGSPYGDAYDTTAVAANNAAAAGVIVVASAGNARDNYFIVGAPSTGDGAISVAASQQTSTGQRGADAVQPADDTVAGFSSRGPRRGDAALKPEISAPGVAIVSAAAGSGYGSRTLSGTSMAAPHVAGAMALLRQLHPTWRSEELKALVMNTSSPLITLGASADASTFAPGRIGAGRLDLAVAGAATAVAFAADRPGLVSLSFGAPQVSDQYVAAINVRVVNKATDAISYAVSYVPVTHMPGVVLETPAAPVQIAAQSAASFAVLLKADAATMQDVRDPTVANEQENRPRAWLSEESGHLLLWPQEAPMRTPLTDTDGVVAGAAEFDFIPATRTLHYTITLPAQRMATTVRVGLGGVESTAPASPPQITAVAGPVATDVRTVNGALRLSNTDVLRLAARALHLTVYPDGVNGGPLSGRITAAAPVLHLPVYAAPRAVANLRASNGMVFPANLTTPGVLPIAGTVPVTAPVSLSVLQLESPNTTPASVAPGEIDRYDHADLRYVGVSSDAAAVNETFVDTAIYFALATYAPWSTPNEVAINVEIDTDEDGFFDKLLYTSNSERFASARSDNDVYVTVLVDLLDGSRKITGPLNGVDVAAVNTWPLFNATMVLGVKANDLGLNAQNSGFAFKVTTYSADLFLREEMKVDETPTLHFDLTSQPIDFTEGTPGLLLRNFAGIGPFAIQGRLNLPAFLAASQPRLLLLHHRGAYNVQAETPPASYAWPYRVHLPVIDR